MSGPGLLQVSSVGEPLEQWLGDRVTLAIRGHDSGCTSYRVRDRTDDLFVKVAYGDDVCCTRSRYRTGWPWSTRGSTARS